MIIFLYGSDIFRSQQQLKKMVGKFKADRDPQGLNVVVVDATQVDPSALLQEILATPFLAERKMIVVKNLLSSKQKEFHGELLERLLGKGFPESNVLVFWEGKGDYRAKATKQLFEHLKKEKFAQFFEELDGASLSAWISSEIKERKGHIHAQALRYLISHVGSDTFKLHHLVNQLTAYKNGGEIRVADVMLFVDETADDNIFNLVDAIVARQSKKVFTMMREQYKKGETAQYIFAMVLRQFKILLQLRDLFEREDNPRSDELAKRLGLHPFVVKKSLPMVKRYTSADLKHVYQELLDIDVKTKTGQGDQSVMLDVFVGRLAAQS